MSLWLIWGNQKIRFGANLRWKPLHNPNQSLDKPGVEIVRRVARVGSQKREQAGTNKQAHPRREKSQGAGRSRRRGVALFCCDKILNWKHGFSASEFQQPSWCQRTKSYSIQRSRKCDGQARKSHNCSAEKGR